MDRLMRNGLTYQQASKNCNRLAQAAYDAAKIAGQPDEEATEAARMAYETEMRWYES